MRSDQQGAPWQIQFDRVKALSKPAIDWKVQVMSLGSLALRVPELRKVGGGASLQRFGTLASRNVQRTAKPGGHFRT
jgi:hypothetical protein